MAVVLPGADGVLSWRLVTRRPVSGLLVLTIVGLTARTAYTFVSGDPTLYLLQPAVTSGLIGAVFLASMATTLPGVGRLARDFYRWATSWRRDPRCSGCSDASTCSGPWCAWSRRSRHELC